jgi:hypothetical protein
MMALLDFILFFYLFSTRFRCVYYLHHILKAQILRNAAARLVVVSRGIPDAVDSLLRGMSLALCEAAA